MSDRPATNLIPVNVGNTRTQIGSVIDGSLDHVTSFSNDDLADTIDAIRAGWNAIAERPRASVVIASVNLPIAQRITSTLQDQLTNEVYRVGVDMPIPIGRRLDPETITGDDRFLNAAAAWASVEQACIVVDAGTAVTVDFVDGEGTFHGGAIAPGARMQLRAMHEFTASLPEIEFSAPEGEAFGRNTAQAMLMGVYHGIRGMVWKLVERYAEAYGAFPMVIATGGDATVLFKDDDLIDRIVPGLTLMGIEVAARHALVGNSAPPDGTGR